MKSKIKNRLFIMGSFILLVLMVMSFFKINEESKEMRKWIQEVNKEVQSVENKEYEIEKLISIKYPASDELKSLGITFFKDEVDFARIRVLEVIIKEKNKSKYATIIAEVNDRNKAENLKKVSGLLVEDRDGRRLIINSVIE